MEQIEDKRCQSCGRKLQREEDRGINVDGTRSEDYCYMCFMNGKFTHPDITMEELIEQGAKDWSEHDPSMSYEKAKEELSKIISQLKRWKKRTSSKVKKVVISGLVAGIVAFLVDMVFFLNPLISEIYSKYSFGLKPIDPFGWLVGSLFSTFFLAVLYSYTEKEIGIKSTWKKGLFFGVLFWLVSRIPFSYFTWLRFKHIDILLNIIETFNGFVSSVIAGILLAILYKKLK